MSFKNQTNELWCECGNRVDLQGFYLIDEHGQFIDDPEFGYKWACDKCNQTCDAELSKVPTKREPEETITSS